VRLVTLGVGAESSPRYAPAGLLVAHRGWGRPIRFAGRVGGHLDVLHVATAVRRARAQTALKDRRRTLSMFVPSIRISRVGPSRFGEWRSPSL